MPMIGLGVYMSQPGPETYNAVRLDTFLGVAVFVTRETNLASQPTGPKYRPESLTFVVGLPVEVL